ncbi:hypothetical protein GC722_05285 [Auraticoccus sp. F435]|uniref:Uncharacterized protein n=1 Tax=Auraticoccus cholistanensis TaxID=2656650 RepID=A0A6A9URQ0_9ACTN|nr:hypothetical protein [Auraticoccus cholistanensis]MVA75443.1 hypothetical protein [Auraticoccus cholistanensis]
MIGLTEALAELVERVRRLSRTQWALRGVMLLSGLLAVAVLWTLAPVAVLSVPVLLLLVAGLLLPRGHVPTGFAAAVVLWSVALADAGVVALVPVTLGLLGWHWAASATAVGRPHARVGRGVVARLAVPLAAAAVSVPVAAVLAGVLAGVRLPPALTATGVLVCLLVAAVGLVLWPAGRSSRD